MYFEIRKNIQGQFHWRLRSANNEIIAHSELYYVKQSAQHSIELVQGTSSNTRIEDLT